MTPHPPACLHLPSGPPFPGPASSRTTWADPSGTALWWGRPPDWGRMPSGAWKRDHHSQVSSCPRGGRGGTQLGPGGRDQKHPGWRVPSLPSPPPAGQCSQGGGSEWGSVGCRQDMAEPQCGPSPHQSCLLPWFCVTEFDKFLEERARAAEMVPDLPSPPGEAPAPASNPSGRKKPERSEDALFAL